MTLSCKGLFEISVYRLPEQKYYEQLSAHIIDVNAGAPNPLSESYLRVGYGGDWRYNEIVGFLNFHRYGNNQIRCEYWETDAKIKVRTRKKQFIKKSDSYCNERYSTKNTNSDLAEIMKSAVKHCEARLKNRTLDRNIFDRMVHFVDWRALLSAP